MGVCFTKIVKPPLEIRRLYFVDTPISPCRINMVINNPLAVNRGVPGLILAECAVILTHIIPKQRYVVIIVYVLNNPGIDQQCYVRIIKVLACIAGHPFFFTVDFYTLF